MFTGFVCGSLLILGLVGLFLTGFDYFSNVTGVALLMFTVNPLTNVIHIVTALLGMAVWSEPARARAFLALIGVLGLPWAIFGYLADGTMADIFGRNPELVTVHLVLSAAALCIAFWPARASRLGQAARETASVPAGPKT